MQTRIARNHLLSPICLQILQERKDPRWSQMSYPRWSQNHSPIPSTLTKHTMCCSRTWLRNISSFQGEGHAPWNPWTPCVSPCGPLRALRCFEILPICRGCVRLSSGCWPKNFNDARLQRRPPQKQSAGDKLPKKSSESNSPPRRPPRLLLIAWKECPSRNRPQ